MRGALIVSLQDRFFDQVAEIMRTAGADVGNDYGGEIRLPDARRPALFLYPAPDGSEFEFRGPPEKVAPGVLPPDMSRASACVVECRSAELFSSTMRLIAGQLTEPVWVLDGDGVLWAAASVDPDRVVL